MPLSIDGSTKIITVPKSYMVLVQSTPSVIYSLDLNQFRLDLKAWEMTPIAMAYPRTHSHNTTVLVGGASLARVIQIINGWTVTFEDGQYRVETAGANSNIGERVNVNQVSVSTSNSAGLQDLNSLQAASYANQVAVQPSSSYAGTTFPVGTREFPVNNFVDAHTILRNRGLREFVILESMAINSGSHAGVILTADNKALVTLTLGAAADVTRSTYTGMTVQGVLDGGSVVSRCQLLDISFFNGDIEDSALFGTITLGGGFDAEIANCVQDDSKHIPIIDLGGSGQDLIMSNWSGEVWLTNCDDVTRTHQITGSGEVFIQPSVVNCQIEVFGDIKITNLSTSPNVIIIDNSTASEVWKHALTNGKSPESILTDMYKIFGLDPTKPLVVDDNNNRRYVGNTNTPDIDQNIISVGNTTTVTRQ